MTRAQERMLRSIVIRERAKVDQGWRIVSLLFFCSGILFGVALGMAL